jgi:hypothetical protein
MFDNKAVLINTNTGAEAEAEVDRFNEQKGFDAYLATQKITFKWNGRTYVGNAFGMEFTSSGPKEINKLKGRF